MKFSKNYKKRILFLHNKIQRTCGITRIMHDIAENTKEEFEIFLLVRKDFLIDEKYNMPFVKVVNINFIPPFELFYILFFVIKNKIQITCSFHRYYDFISFLLSEFINIETVTIVQSKVFGKRILSYNAKKLIAVSRYIREHLTTEFYKDKSEIEIIPNFIDVKSIKTTIGENWNINAQFGLEDDTTIIGFVGRINIEEKGVDILLKAINNLKNNYKLALLIVGDGPDLEFVVNYAKSNNLKVIHIPGNSEIFNYYKLFDLFVLPSRIEPFGIVLLEAGFFQVPIIASDVDGIPEIIKNNVTGLLFNSEDVDDLTRKIRFMLDNPDYANTVKVNLFELVTNEFSSQNIIPKYKTLFNSLSHIIHE